MKKIKALLVVTMLAGLLTACGKGNEPKIETKGKCNAFECIKKLSVTNTLEEINDTIGFNGEQTNESDYSTTYSWKLSDDSSIDASISKSDNAVSYKIYYPRMLDESYGNKENFHKFLLTIPTKQIILPKQLIYTEKGE